jgi:hypothetical protein
LHLLEHEIVDFVEHVLTLLWIAQHIGEHVVEDGVLAKIELDHARHIAIHRLVVGNAVAERPP